MFHDDDDEDVFDTAGINSQPMMSNNSFLNSGQHNVLNNTMNNNNNLDNSKLNNSRFTHQTSNFNNTSKSSMYGGGLPSSQPFANTSFKSYSMNKPTGIFLSNREQLPQCMEYINNKISNTMALLPLMSFYSEANAMNSFRLDFNNSDNDIFVVNVLYYLLKEREDDSASKVTLQDKVKRLQCDQSALQLNNNKLEQKIVELQKLYNLEQQKHTTLQKESRMKLKKLETAKTALESQNKNIQQKCDQYEHNLIKMEKEMDKLKQQMTHKLNMLLNMNLYGSNLNSSKVDVINQTNHPAISSPAITLSPHHNKSFAWKHGLERNEDILYQNVVEAFKDEKQEILAENQQLKRSLKQLNGELNNLRQQYSITAPLFDSLKDGQFELPYHLAQEEIESAIRDKIQDISNIMGKSSHLGGGGGMHSLDADVDDIDLTDPVSVKIALDSLRNQCNEYRRQLNSRLEHYPFQHTFSTASLGQNRSESSPTFPTNIPRLHTDDQNLEQLMLDTNEIPLDEDVAVSAHSITTNYNFL
ncbi:predicted protein [Naegleria gruberi]|uniref:Predicted protein n=1 Tax=Naegleria gruberi TaxID=5762 RepID=D2VC31_NAEGR|nr:uncharacterized protein NAEGRDRAFT_48332 [Naegleria gruberi]EFC45587.1 predicted protein [Naegleria gruberi]|eukprot:XP_002678331.1 predicted protein [Naegleria gruberi strain NEG-M]